jgi:hypothetical protein
MLKVWFDPVIVKRKIHLVGLFLNKIHPLFFILLWEDDILGWLQENTGNTPQQFISCARENYMLVWQIDQQVINV